MITLPPPRRLYLTSFALTIGLCAVLLGGLLSWQLGSWPMLGGGAAVALAAAGMGLAWPAGVAVAYRFWRRLAHYMARRLAVVLLGLCFYIVFVAVGRAGARLRLERPRPNGSLWIPRGDPASLGAARYPSPLAVPIHRTGLCGSLLSWAKSSGNLWACCLLPFLMLLRALEPESVDDVPTNIYTLF